MGRFAHALEGGNPLPPFWKSIFPAKAIFKKD